MRKRKSLRCLGGGGGVEGGGTGWWIDCVS